MIDVEVPVIDALEKDPAVFAIVGTKIHRWAVREEDEENYPYIRVVELNNTDNDYRDNKAGSSDVPIQVDFWTKDDPAIIQKAIDDVMKSLQFKRTGVTSFYDRETEVMRKALRYTTKVKLEEE